MEFHRLIPLQYTRWQVFAAFDIATEVALFAISIYIIHDLQMPWKKKNVIGLAFGLRLP